MIRPTSARERRLVVLLLLVAAVAAVWFALVSPIINGFAARAARREQISVLYVHNLRIIGSIPRLRREAEEGRTAIRTFVISARNVEEGREWLKDRVRKAIEQASGEFREAVDADDQPGRARIRASARMTLPQLTATLTRLQNTPPWLVIESLSISSNDALVTGESSSMDVQFEASIPFRAASAR